MDGGWSGGDCSWCSRLLTRDIGIEMSAENALKIVFDELLVKATRSRAILVGEDE